MYIHIIVIYIHLYRSMYVQFLLGLTNGLCLTWFAILKSQLPEGFQELAGMALLLGSLMPSKLSPRVLQRHSVHESKSSALPCFAWMKYDKEFHKCAGQLAYPYSECSITIAILSTSTLCSMAASPVT